MSVNERNALRRMRNRFVARIQPGKLQWAALEQ
jgi:hypothetical protein